GFAMGTVAGANTRRYHGLLVASLRPPVDRHVLLSRLEEVVSDGDVEVPLGTAQYPGVLSPSGYRNLIEFRLDPFPTWVYDVGGAHVEKQLFLVRGEETVGVQYRGLDFSEDLWRMGSLSLEVGPEMPVFVVATLGSRQVDSAEVERLAAAERERRRPRSEDRFAARLELAADQFVARRRDGEPT